MMHRTLGVWVVLIVSAARLTALGGPGAPAVRKAGTRWEIAAGSMVVTVDPTCARIVAIRVADRTVAAGTGGAQFIDGKAKRALTPVAVTKVQATNRRLSVQWSATSAHLTGRYVIEPHRDVIRWAVTVENPGPEQRWLEVRLGLPVDPKRGWQYWDGRNPPVKVTPESRILGAKADPVLADDACTRLTSHYGLNVPINCVWTTDAGLGVGLDPAALRSYFAGGSEPGLSSADAVYYATKLAIDPGRSETVPFILFAFDPAYGFRGALERLYAAFPGAYRPDPATDPRMQDNCAVTGTAALFDGKSFLWEDARRLRLGWTWGTNTRYGGLCYPDDAHAQSPTQRQQSYWSFTHPYYKKPSWVKAAVTQHGTLSPDQHRRYAREAFAGSADALAVALDITTQYCDKALVDREFVDSTLVKANGTRVNIPKIHIMYAWANRFGRLHARLVHEALTTLEPAGVHFDNAVGYDPHYGTGVAQSPGRAFDVKAGKVYSLEGVAQALHMSAARTHTVRNRRTFVAANTVGTYFGARLCDVSLIESLGPWHDKDPNRRWRGKHAQPGFEHYMASRFLLGSKPLVFCGPYPWEVKLTEAQKKLPYKQRATLHTTAYEAMTHDYPLFAYRVGAPTISYVLRRCANVRHHVPTILALCRAGWQPVPAARADMPSLWVERFGTGVGAYLTVGNPTDAPVRATVTFDAQRWGGVVALTLAGGAPVRTVVANGTTRVPVSIDARRPVAWQVVARLSPAPPDGTVLTTRMVGGTTRIELTCPRACNTTVRAAIPDAHALQSASVGGRRQQARTRGTCVETDVVISPSVGNHLAPGDSPGANGDHRAQTVVVEIRHVSRYPVDASAAGFAFFRDRTCCSAIVLRKGATAPERTTAERLSRYFQYYFAHRKHPFQRPGRLWHEADDAHQIPVVDPGRVPAKGNLVLIGAPALPTVRGVSHVPDLSAPLAGRVDVINSDAGRRVLVLKARSAADLDPTLRALLAQLDTRYPF